MTSAPAADATRARVQAQQAMGVMLPQLRLLLYDPVARVRVAMAELLERVSTLSALQWWSIVPAAELIGVLATDSSDVAPIIQRLLFSQLIRPDPELNLSVRVLATPAFRTSCCTGFDLPLSWTVAYTWCCPLDLAVQQCMLLWTRTMC
jgi:hypothetical protein